ncbi:MAG: DUF421 domain-containing protein [Chloroflexota bacterium]
MVAEVGALTTVVFHTVVIYLLLILGLSFLGRREIAQLTVAELTVLMVMGSAVETAMVAGNLSLLAGLTSATILFLCNRGFTFLIQRWPTFHRLAIGTPVILVHDGHVVPGNLRAVGLTEADVREGIRERGYAGPGDLRFVVLEVDGSIGVIPRVTALHRHRRRAWLHRPSPAPR